MDPIITAIAAAAAGKLAEETARGIAAAGRFIRARFAKDPGNAVVLQEAEADAAGVDRLAARIQAACAADPGFLRQLRELTGDHFEVTQVDQSRQHVKFQNNFHSGGPNNVIQGETINIQNLN